jgi:hypothetical protein
MKIWGSAGIAPTFLTLALYRIKLSGKFHVLNVLSPPGRISSTHWTGGWVGLRAGLDAVEWGKNACAGIRTPNVQPVACHYTNSFRKTHL